MISSGPGQRLREHHKDDQEGRGISPTAFSPGLPPRMLNTPSLPRVVAEGRGGGEAYALTLQLAQDPFLSQPSPIPPQPLGLNICS